MTRKDQYVLSIKRLPIIKDLCDMKRIVQSRRPKLIKDHYKPSDKRQVASVYKAVDNI
jgi:hypothetical protein